MEPTIRLCLVLHNHQPIGNFDHVLEQAYQDSYLPFLQVFERFEHLRIGLHTSGPLLEWLDEHHPDYLDRLAHLVQAGRIEPIGGAFYEPILTMIPSRDRFGQITQFSRWLEQRLGGRVQGMWVAERVWEQSLTKDLAASGIRYTVLDDFHFRTAGLSQEQLYGYYLTEDDGQLLSIFPGSERLRYLIPFGAVEETIEYLRQIGQQFPGAVVVFGDDGEKFGVWPETKQHVYEHGWLQRFFEALEANRPWLEVTTLADAVRSVPPQGKIYLPDASYREMTEWALPVSRQLEYEDLVHSLEHDERWQRLRPFIRGGFWRNFKVKYPEANIMYARMMMVSRRLQQLEQSGHNGQQLEAARRQLYRGQCNCAYWHGAFGGIYLPHLRNAVYHHLIAADNLLDQLAGDEQPAVEATADDYNFDARQEVRLKNSQLLCLFAPAQGGHLYELDVRSICHNLLATMTRRPEAYHRKIAAGNQTHNGDVASIHDRVVCKQEGLDRCLQYDPLPRFSLVDHFFDPDVTVQAVQQSQAAERGDFALGVYEARLRRGPQRAQVEMTRTGQIGQLVVRLTKTVTLAANQSELEIVYRLEQLPARQPLHFAVELNFAGLPAGADDRYFHLPGNPPMGHLGTPLDLADVRCLGLKDEWLGIDVQWSANRPTHLWTFPVETVSQSEGGFELVHQSVVLMPHWLVQPDEQGSWAVSMRLVIDTTAAKSRSGSTTAAAKC